MNKLFQTLDKTGKNIIFYKEFKTLIHCIDSNVEEAQIKHIFDTFDSDGNKELSLVILVLFC